MKWLSPIRKTDTKGDSSMPEGYRPKQNTTYDPELEGQETRNIIPAALQKAIGNIICLAKEVNQGVLPTDTMSQLSDQFEPGTYERRLADQMEYMSSPRIWHRNGNGVDRQKLLQANSQIAALGAQRLVETDTGIDIVQVGSNGDGTRHTIGSYVDAEHYSELIKQITSPVTDGETGAYCFEIAGQRLYTEDTVQRLKEEKDAVVKEKSDLEKRLYEPGTEENLPAQSSQASETSEANLTRLGSSTESVIDYVRDTITGLADTARKIGNISGDAKFQEAYVRKVADTISQAAADALAREPELIRESERLQAALEVTQSSLADYRRSDQVKSQMIESLKSIVEQYEELHSISIAELDRVLMVNDDLTGLSGILERWKEASRSSEIGYAHDNKRLLGDNLHLEEKLSDTELSLAASERQRTIENDLAEERITEQGERIRQLTGCVQVLGEHLGSLCYGAKDYMQKSKAFRRDVGMQGDIIDLQPTSLQTWAATSDPEQLAMAISSGDLDVGGVFQIIYDDMRWLYDSCKSLQAENKQVVERLENYDHRLGVQTEQIEALDQGVEDLKRQLAVSSKVKLPRQ